MTSSPRRAVITGFGTFSSLGTDLAAFWQALRDRRSGVRPITTLNPEELPSRMAGDVQNFEPNQILREKAERKVLRVMARTVQLGVCAAQKAVEHAGIIKGTIEPTRFGVEFGAGMIATELDDISHASRVSVNCQPGVVNLATWGSSLREIPPLWMLKYLPNMPACHVSIFHNAQGPSNTITESDVAGVLALGEAWRIIERDTADIFLVGGTESKLNPLSLTRHNLFQPLSRRNAEPEKALRPFDANRDGTVLAEGATVMAVEEVAHARRRGAKIIAEVVGFASGFDRKKKGPTLARVIGKALTEAGIGPGDLDHVNAFGLGTRESDAWEARGLAELLRDHQHVPIWAPKANLGSSGAAGGLTELTASLLALEHRVIPATINHDSPDPECPIRISTEEMPGRSPFALKLSLTDLGQIAAIVVRRWDD